MKSEKGITGIDLSISIIIIMLFVSIIAALSINVSTSLASKRRLDIATECIGKIMEKLDAIDYENVETDIDDINSTPPLPINKVGSYGENSLRKEVANILNSDEKFDILDVYLKTENYKPEGQTADLIKKVTVKIQYKLNKQDENIEVARLKTRYNINLEPSPSPTATITPTSTP